MSRRKRPDKPASLADLPLGRTGFGGVDAQILGHGHCYNRPGPRGVMMRPILLLLAVPAILVAGCGGGRSGGGTPVATHTLVFVDSGSFSADIWSMLSDGTAAVPRFTNAADDRQPWLHRDTGDVYYIKDDFAIFRSSSSSSSEFPVMTSAAPISAMTYRKQSDQLVIAQNGTLSIVTLTPFSSTVKLATGGAVRRLRMSEDGSHILAVVLVGTLWQVIRYEFAGPGSTPLVTSNLGSPIDDAIENAADGMVYVINGDTLTKVPASGGASQQVVQPIPGSNGLDVDLAFSPDYTRLYYAIELTGVFSMPVAGGPATPIRGSGSQIHSGL